MTTTTIRTAPIPLHPVESSQIAAIGHDPETNTLAIQFTAKNVPGSIYHYGNFDAEAFAFFKGAESIGSHFGKFIKPHPDKYPYVKVKAAVTGPVEPPRPLGHYPVA